MRHHMACFLCSAPLQLKHQNTVRVFILGCSSSTLSLRTRKPCPHGHGFCVRLLPPPPHPQKTTKMCPTWACFRVFLLPLPPQPLNTKHVPYRHVFCVCPAPPLQHEKCTILCVFHGGECPECQNEPTKLVLTF